MALVLEEALLDRAHGKISAADFLARIVSALACQPVIPTFLLATVRPYGHGGDSDHHPLLASVLKPPRPLGAACLVT